MATKKKSEKSVKLHAKARVIGGALRLREDPDLKAKNLCYMAEGEIVNAAKFNKDWMHVEFGDLNGYSMAKYLEFIDEPKEEAPEAETVEE